MTELAVALVVVFLLLCVYPRPRSGGGQRYVANRPPLRTQARIPGPPPRARRLLTCRELRRRGMAICQACHLGEHWHCESPEVV